MASGPNGNGGEGRRRATIADAIYPCEPGSEDACAGLADRRGVLQQVVEFALQRIERGAPGRRHQALIIGLNLNATLV